jgi:hypothetical protein
MTEQTTSSFNRTETETIKKVDQDDTYKLELYTYTTCDESSDQSVKQSRGVVVNTVDDSVVLRSFNYTPEFNEYQIDLIQPHLSDELVRKSLFYDSHEGALLRAFYFMDKWFLSTHRKLDAFKSKWASNETFGEIFEKSLYEEVKVNEDLARKFDNNYTNLTPKFLSTLDKRYQYMFLVRNTEENRIVNFPPLKPTLYHVGTFIDGRVSMGIDCGVSKPAVHKFTSLNDVCAYVHENVNVQYTQGVIAFTPNNTQIKIVNKEYQEMVYVRGFEPSIKFRYLQIRMDRYIREKLYLLYPDMESTFNEIENTIYDIALYLYRSYVARFIKREHITLPKFEYKLMELCHSWHMEDRATNKVSVNKIIDILNNQSPSNLNHMIRRFKMDNSTDTEKQHQQPRTRPRLIKNN